METRRRFLKKGLYITPVVMSLAVRPALAGSPYKCGNGPPRPFQFPAHTNTSSQAGPKGSGGGGPKWWEFWQRM